MSVLFFGLVGFRWLRQSISLLWHVYFKELCAGTLDFCELLATAGYY